MTQGHDLPGDTPVQQRLSPKHGQESGILLGNHQTGNEIHFHPVTHQYTHNSDRQGNSADYDIPDSYRNLDDAFDEAPVQDSSKGSMRHHTSREERFAPEEGAGTANATETPKVDGRQNQPSQASSNRKASVRQRRQSASGFNYDVPDQYVNAAELLSEGPVQNPDEAALYKHESLEESRSRDQDFLRRQSLSRSQHSRAVSDGNERATRPQVPEEKQKHREVQVSKLATQIYTISYLILFSIFGTLARLGLQALTSYHGAPVTFSSVWPNFAGSLVMGFLSEDRMLFRHEWGTPTYEQQIQKARRQQTDEESGESLSGQEAVNLAAAKKAHMATKKTIPLYIGLATGFCGSFTSFSSFIRDAFLSLSNDLPSPDLGTNTIPRNGGYSFEALLAVMLTTVSLSLAGLFVGAHLAIALERFTPTFPFAFTRKVIDRVAVVLALGCWVGAVILCAIPPDRFSHGLGAAETWRGRVTFALVFAPLGCLARFYASLYLNGRIASFPLGTFAINIFGTVILAMAWDIAHVPEGGVIGCQVLQGIEDGFCGCLTTISTWVSELAALRRRHAYTYGLVSVVVALACMIVIMGGLRWSQGFAGLMCLH
ncbi:putative Fluoride export protein 1 [Seiridium cardinale]|uniref:Fluoride export protein 1 n=1 Tax=Seiridium cardinale TaxID=138064 RepID=A0ABR2XV84_9PEZI